MLHQAFRDWQFVVSGAAAHASGNGGALQARTASTAVTADSHRLCAALPVAYSVKGQVHKGETRLE